MALTTESAKRMPARSPQKKSALLTWADTVSPDESPLIRLPRKLFRILLISLIEMKANVLTIRAGYLTYAILLSMVPMLAMSTAVVKGLGGGDELREVAYTYIASLERSSTQDDNQLSPSTETSSQEKPQTEEAEGTKDLVGQLSSAVDQIFDYVDRTNFATLGTFGMIGIFFSVILVLGQVEKSLNVIWKVEDGRSFLRKVADYLALMIMMPIALNVALASGTMLKSKSLNIRVDQYLPIEWIQILLLKGVPILVLSITLYAVYIFFPNTKTRGMATMTGALIAGTGWFITQNVYISMQIGVAKYNAIYGSFASIPLLLAWIWVGCLFVLLGAQIGYAIKIEKHYHFITRTPRPVMQISAALDICSLIGKRFSALQPTYQSDIIELCPEYNQDLLDDVLDGLIHHGVLHYKRENNEIMPSRPPELLTNQKIVETVLGRDMPNTPGGQTTLQAMSGIVESFPEDRVAENGEISKTVAAETAELPAESGEDKTGNKQQGS